MTIPEDVRLVINGWLESRSQLALVGQVFNLGIALRCRVVALTEERVELGTVDGGRISVPLVDPTLTFRYAEPREFPDPIGGLTEEQSLASSLTITFPSRVRLDALEDVSDTPETVCLMELIE